MTDTAAASNGEQHPESLAAIAEQVVALLTRAARMRRPARASVPGDTAPAGVEATEPIDFAGFLVPILATVTANRGGIGALLAGRPGSWEADKLDELLLSAGCENRDQLVRYRSEPIVIDVPIDHIISDTRDLVLDPDNPGNKVWRRAIPHEETYDEQLNALQLDEADTGAALETRYANKELSEADYEREATAHEREYDLRQHDLRQRWTARYTRYLDAFRLVVTARAAELGYTVPIEVRGETDPEKSWDYSQKLPSLWNTDLLAHELYEHAVLNTPLRWLRTDAPA